MSTSIPRPTWWRLIPVFGALVWLAAGGLATPAFASRFDPPWQSRVVVERATLYTQADRSSVPVGPLTRGQVVVVVNELTGTDGAAWTQVPDGFLASSDIAEDMTPWIAEVSVPSVAIYARPSAREPIRRTAKQGDLLRVTGVSPGIEGDTATWWSTTEGYVDLNTLREATSDWAQNWTLPDGTDAASGWWGAIRSQANVRAAATTGAPVVGGLVPGDRVKVLGEVTGAAVNGNTTWYGIDGGRYAGAVVHSSLVTRMPEPKQVLADRPADAPAGLGTLVVSRSAATLTLLDADNTPRFTTYVSLGRAGVETPEGEYATMGKYRFDTMSSLTVANADHAYHLPNVPFVQYYLDGGYAIHSTYWHDHFGLVESQGCINLTWSDGEYLFGLTQPTVAVGDVARWAINIPATPLIIVP
ncbi:MAG: SH3 domain-containing protein [Chloroflexi bacterium]|nr:SH3 domain-containing protein [Chloroflexota bacterium]